MTAECVDRAHRPRWLSPPGRNRTFKTHEKSGPHVQDTATKHPRSYRDAVYAGCAVLLEHDYTSAVVLTAKCLRSNTGTRPCRYASMGAFVCTCVRMVVRMRACGKLSKGNLTKTLLRNLETILLGVKLAFSPLSRALSLPCPWSPAITRRQRLRPVPPHPPSIF